jgi:hypothetical protein
VLFNSSALHSHFIPCLPCNYPCPCPPHTATTTPPRICYSIPSLFGYFTPTLAPPSINWFIHRPRTSTTSFIHLTLPLSPQHPSITHSYSYSYHIPISIPHHIRLSCCM